jgi:outer membrane protein
MTVVRCEDRDKEAVMAKFTRWVFVVGTVTTLLLGAATAPALADDGDWMFRFRVIGIAPDDSGTDMLEDIEVDGDFTIEIDVTRFFTEHLALEVIAATAAQPLAVDGSSIGSVNHLPPTATLQWHFLPAGEFRPYVGGGVNYTIFYEQTGLVDEFDLDDSFGLAGQLGADIMLGQKVFLNIDLKYIQIETDVKVDGSKMGTVEINPWVIGFGFGHRW